MTSADIRRLVDEHLHDSGSGWSMGTIGAIAEFVRDPDEPVSLTGTTVVTTQGGIRLALPDSVRAVAYETPAGPHDHWNHAVAFCLPTASARQAARTVITELGPDSAGLRPEDREGVLATPTAADHVVPRRTPARHPIRRLVGYALGAGGSTVLTLGVVEARGNPVRFRDCPAAVSGNDRRHEHWAPRLESEGPGKRRALGPSVRPRGAHQSEDLPPACTPTPSLRAPSLRFESVTYRYPTGNSPAVTDLIFELAAGEHVAIVGRSGAGKSTVVALLMRFCDPTSGRILIDGHDIADLDLHHYRSALAIVSQDTYLFHGTIQENLLLARPDAGAAQLEEACRAANAAEFIHALPQGYETVVAERGMRLSGGQRQRIAIARALLADAPILVLDEATSSVDTAGEAAIHEALDRLTAGRTTLVIAHRLSTIRDADRILVLDRGRLVEQGAHLDLHRAGGAYHRLVQAQETR